MIGVACSVDGPEGRSGRYACVTAFAARYHFCFPHALGHLEWYDCGVYFVLFASSVRVVDVDPCDSSARSCAFVSNMPSANAVRK